MENLSRELKRARAHWRERIRLKGIAPPLNITLVADLARRESWAANIEIRLLT